MSQDQMQTKNDQVQVTPLQPTQLTYTPPTVTMYDEQDLLKTVAVLGCSPF